MSSIECNMELVDLVDMYIYLQLHNPLVIDEVEPKQYPKEAVEYYAKNYNSHEDLLYKISSIFEKRNNYLLENDITYTLDYSRTEFYSNCFQALTENYSMDEIVKIVNELKFNYLKDDNYNFAEFAINKITSKSLSKKQKIVAYVKKRR